MPIRRSQKKSNAEPRQKQNHRRLVIDPMVNPGSSPHRHQARSKADPTRPHHRMVTLAQSSPGDRSARAPQSKTATVMLESVRRLQAGLQSFLSMRRIEARRKKASAFRLRFSQSLASLRPAIEPCNGALDDPAFGQDHKSADLIGTFDDFNAEMRQNLCNPFRKFRSLIATVDEQRLQKGKHTEQCRHDENASIAILNVGRMNDGVEQEA